MKFAKILGAAALASAVVYTAPAQAAVIATLTFDTPTGIVLSNADIPVYLTLMLDPTSDPITTDSSSTVTSPLSAQVISDLHGHSSDVLVNESIGCGGSLDGCNSAGSAYTFNFNFGADNFVTPANLNLQPGDSLSFLLGTFTPNGGNAAPGVYALSNASVNFQYSNSATSEFYLSAIANGCGPNASGCFSRTVLAAGAVPEPASWGLMMLGVAGVGGALRTHRRAGRPSGAKTASA